MGKVILFALPKTEPERELAQQMQCFGDFSRRSDAWTREQVEVLVSVLGMRDLATLCVDCALAEIVKLCERPDVNAVLNAHQQGKATRANSRN
jgi:hypothetical protein